MKDREKAGREENKDDLHCRLWLAMEHVDRLCQALDGPRLIRSESEDSWSRVMMVWVWSGRYDGMMGRSKELYDLQYETS